ncbi:MAG: threonine synthase [Actinobacteria bacterium]|nr:threonine synthase [Actinomycetota bacterium]MCB9389730.1 threonine synthase [Acidimicrobiia bacterium]
MAATHADFVRALRCRECGHEYEIAPIHVCEWCFGPLEVAYDYDAIASVITRESIAAGPSSIWRYEPLLPTPREPLIDMGAGFTPLVRAHRLGEVLGLSDLWIKNDTLNPTNSFKDRVVTVALSKAVNFGFKTAACASTGNLANSVAAHSAHAGLDSYVFIPSDLEAGKVTTSAVYGGNLVAIDGSYDDVNRLCAELAGTYPWAFVNVNVRPFYAEGSKTLAYETVEQLGWQLPDHCVVPVASGSLLTKIKKGFEELVKVGLIDGPADVRMSGADSEGCSPVATAFLEGTDTIKPVKPNTIAKSLAIGNPADGYFALDVVRQSGGGMAAISDDEVVEGIRLLAETEGIFGETAAGVTIATLKTLTEQGVIRPDEKVVAYVTGHGLKTLEAVQPVVGPTATIAPTLDAFNEAFQIEE